MIAAWNAQLAKCMESRSPMDVGALPPKLVVPAQNPRAVGGVAETDFITLN
jgi:hypothetical protein